VYADAQTVNYNSGNLEFCAPFNERTLIGWNPVKKSKIMEKARIKQK